MLTRIRDWSLFHKLIALAVVAILPVILGLVMFALPRIEAHLYAEKETQVKQLAESAFAIIEDFAQRAEEGELSVEEAQQGAAHALRAARYDDGTGYFWIHDLDYRYVMYPLDQSKLEADMYEFVDPNGVYLVREMNAVAEAEGEGLVEYAWVKPGEETPSAKFSYIKFYAPWEWVVGTGIYVDDVEKQVARLQRQMMWVLLGALALAGIFVFLMSVRLRRPIASLQEAARRVTAGQLDVEVTADSNDEVGRLGSSFNRMVEQIRESLSAADAERVAAEAARAEAEEARRHAEAQQGYLETQTERMLAVMERLADGDLSVHLEAERDDTIAELFQGFNRTVERLRNLIGELRSAVDHAAVTSTELNASTDELAASTQEQSAQAEEVAAAVEQMARTVLANSESVHATAAEAENNGRRAREGGAVVDQTVDKIREIAEVVENSAATIERLGASSGQIGEIVETIEDIADQTNLLALNAAIEAARAGEQGRGFAVVADEVRKLAERTAQATGEIATMIGQVQRETREAVQAMRSGTERVHEGIQLADETRVVLHDIVEGAVGITDRVSQMASATQEQSVTGEQISRSVQTISAVTSESAIGVSHIARATEDLSQLTEQLRGLTSQFLLGGHAAPACANRANGAGDGTSLRATFPHEREPVACS